MESALINGLMALGTLAKLASVFRAAVSHLIRRYPLFALMALFGAVRTAALLIALSPIARRGLYVEIWQTTENATLALQAASCFEAFWILALHFRNIKAFGAVVFSIMAGVAGILSYFLVLATTGKWTTPFAGAAIVMQRVALALIVITLLAPLFFRQFPTVPIRPNAIRHLRILTLLFGSFLLSGFILNGPTSVFASSFTLTLGTVIAYVWWALCMTAEGEKLPFVPGPPLSPEGFEAADAADREAMKAPSRALRPTRDQPH